ncbi:MAG TPA: M13-type metalloendopeptidase [Kofleriaceae bacterium]|nr:M13-type metalloendopeptidase [Kofleriaceae bacterium]
MIRNCLLTASLIAAVASCSKTDEKPAPAPTTKDTPTPKPTPTTPEGPTAPPAPAKPGPAHAEIGEWGFDKTGMDSSAEPGMNFYKYANGAWEKNTPIPEDKSNYGMFTVLQDKSEARTKEIIENAKGGSPEEQKVGDFYRAFLDDKAIEAKGVAPVKPELDAINAIKTPADLAKMFGVFARHFGTSPFRTFVGQDDRDPEHYIAIIGQGGLGLPDRDMYDAKKPQFAPQREGYKKYIADMFKLVDIKDAEPRAEAVYALEDKIAAVHWTKVQNRDAQKRYNKMTIAELEKLAPGFDWKTWLTTVGLDGQTSVNVNQPSVMAAEAKIIEATPIAVWRDYLTVHLLTGTADELPKKFVDTHFEMYGKVLSGTPVLKDRWKRGVDEVTGAMGEAVGKLYVAKYFTPETKAHADALVKNLLTAMGARLDALAWMTPETKAKAKAKLATYNPKIGYPKKWRDYSKLEIVAGDAFGNAERAAAFEYDRLLAHLGQPVDRDEWGMTPMTVNAYYNPRLNEIVFPAAILQPPFFDPNADDAVNYGGIGAVIGHEISHGFDDQGRQYDEKGALKDWWTKDDAAKFKVGTDKLVAQYNTYCPFPATKNKPAQCVNGALTLGENIADLAGLTVAYNAYKLSLRGKDAPVVDSLSGDQRFFLGWAQVWRRSYREAELQNRLSTDVHSPSEARASVVRNLDVWYDAFKPEVGKGLALPADQRVKIW